MRATADQLRAAIDALSPTEPLAIFDCGEDGTLVAWGDGPAVAEGPDWPAQARALLGEDALLVGWIAYEAGAAFERMPAPARPLRQPAVRLWRPARSIWLRGAAPEAPPPQRPRPAARALPGAAPEAYQGSVAQLLEFIAEGDVYQANLAWEAGPLPCPAPLSLWLRLRAENPAERGAFVRYGGHALISNSPELFLKVRPDGEGSIAETAPIKGTAVGTEAGAAYLRASEKERAELTMIVDMARNDLSRVARPGTVLAGPRTLRRCGDLWHAEQRIQGAAGGEVHSFDWIAASFPPASVTGAPKVRAMQRIHELEAGPRGAYTGAIGWLRGPREAHLNVAIRTLCWAEGQAHVHLGAGIVADSSPLGEWQETLHKGAALAAALGDPP